jgi:hypothetical protein
MIIDLDICWGIRRTESKNKLVSKIHEYRFTCIEMDQELIGLVEHLH